jgi:hypothetical protein
MPFSLSLLLVSVRGKDSEIHTMPCIIVDPSEIPDPLHSVRLDIMRSVSGFADDRDFIVLLLFWDLNITFPKCPCPRPVERLIRTFRQLSILPGLSTVDADINSNNA